MADDLGSISAGAFRQLGRMWNRLAWAALVVFAVVWDVFAFLAIPPVDSVQAFIAGAATGMVFSGLIATLVRERYRSPPSEDARRG
jgi:hypothetical protein